MFQTTRFKDLTFEGFTEQLRRTASFHQRDDPSIYYYLTWASPP